MSPSPTDNEFTSYYHNNTNNYCSPNDNNIMPPLRRAMLHHRPGTHNHLHTWPQMSPRRRRMHRLHSHMRNSRLPWVLFEDGVRGWWDRVCQGEGVLHADGGLYRELRSQCDDHDDVTLTASSASARCGWDPWFGGDGGFCAGPFAEETPACGGKFKLR